jgi:hypothetical protein
MRVNRMDRKFWKILLGGLCLLAFTADSSQARFLSAKQARRRPRARIACLPSATVGVRYPNPFALGGHSYENPGFWERNGIVYTCRGGHIDITHLRKLTDWTAYLAYRLRTAILAHHTDFSFRMREPSVYHVRIEYPENWQQLPTSTRDEMATEVSIELGSYLAYTVSVWHEMLTWFGYKSIGFYPEYVSSFSWEDCYSNALGCRIAETALRDPDREFNQAVTQLLNRELARLGVQPKPAAWVAGKAVHGNWFTGNYFWYHMVKRNFDIGLDDGFITPWLAPGMSACAESRPADCPVPTLAFLQPLGFAVRVEIELREWERKKILRIIYCHGRAGRIDPTRHFGPILDYIRAQAARRYGPNVDRPGATTTNPPVSNVPDLSALAARWLRDETS